jgi:hypothetical protein
MKKILSTVLSLCYLLFAASCYAGTDPISWSVSPSSGFPTQATLGSSYAVSYTMTNNLPFAVPLAVTAAYTGGTFALTNGCNTTLAPKGQAGSSCLVHLGLQPIKAGQSTARLTLAYHSNRVPLPVVGTTVAGGVQQITGHVTTPLPAVTYVGASYNVAFTFFNSGSTNVIPTAVNVSGFTPITNTCAAFFKPASNGAVPGGLAPNSTCVVSGRLTPNVSGQTTLTVTYVYNSGGVKSVPLTSQTNVINGGACHHINGQAVLPLPTNTYQYADNVVRYVFTNHCPATSEKVGRISITSDATSNLPTLTTGADSCSDRTLAANGGSCYVDVSVVPNGVTGSANDLSVTAALSYTNGTASTTTSEIVNAITNQSSLHTVMFVNQCSENVWYEFQNGIGGTGPTRKSPDPTPPGQRTLADYQINAQITGAAPVTKVLNVAEYLNGAIYGRTQCDAAGVCQTANCQVIANTGTCVAGQGAATPVTIFELNMNSTTATDGVYDVSMVNGFNIPGEVRSMSPTISPFNFNQACGQSAGAVIQPSGSPLGMCPWSFAPPSSISPDVSPNFIWVTAGAEDGCTSSSSCTSGNVCGMAYNVGPTTTSNAGTPINRRCGKFLGYWTLADFAAFSASNQWGSINLYTAYNMGSSLSAAYGSGLIANLFECLETSNGSLLSGYSSTLNVCGCYNWNQSGSVAKTAQAYNCSVPSTQNPDWLSRVFPRISWLKTACPTAYSYQYDDPSVSFTCNVTSKKTSYQITFCPNGKRGR